MCNFHSQDRSGLKVIPITHLWKIVPAKNKGPLQFRIDVDENMLILHLG